MIRITDRPIDLSGLLVGLPETGALATFVGRVRGDDGVTELLLEHYPHATERALEAIAAEAAGRWELSEAIIVHRVGAMAPGDAIVFVAAAAGHRQPALDACAFMIDRLKTQAPLWKRETRGQEHRWVEQRGGDHAAAARWDQLPEGAS
jgi:molybdopterin synthase catalytic subunit